ncbi:MAG: hypothetical protein P8080_02390 [Gammaproteobacteria bacterium]
MQHDMTHCRRLPFHAVLLAGLLATAAGPAAAADCLADDAGRLEMIVNGSLEARIAWSGGSLRCDGMPRPDGSGLRLMFGNEAEALLVVIGVTGAARGETAEDLPANLTLVREGEGEFYSTLGDDICQVTLTENRPEAGREAGIFRVSGTGECARPIPAVAREGEVRVRPFSFTGRVLWPAEAENVP